MSEIYPTSEEIQAWLDEIWVIDPNLWEYLMLSEYNEEPAEFDLDALEERLYLTGEYDEEECESFPCSS